MIVKRYESKPVTLEKVLLVEGDTPSHIFEALARELRLNDVIEIRNYGGIGDLGKFLKTIAVTPGFKENVKSLGITRDAEASAERARQSVDTAIANANIKDVEVKVKILPDDADCGNIETICLRSVENEDVYLCVNQFFTCVKEKGIPLPDEPSVHKHYAQVYMASKHEVQMFPGMAANKGVWPLAAEAFRPLKEFLESL